jgi:hypothetical protein
MQRNTLYYGDSLEILRQYLGEEAGYSGEDEKSKGGTIMNETGEVIQIQGGTELANADSLGFEMTWV